MLIWQAEWQNKFVHIYPNKARKLPLKYVRHLKNEKFDTQLCVYWNLVYFDKWRNTFIGDKITVVYKVWTVHTNTCFGWLLFFKYASYMFIHFSTRPLLFSFLFFGESFSSESKHFGVTNVSVSPTPDLTNRGINHKKLQIAKYESFTS